MSMKKIKCVVWDLDYTIWDGILIEDKEVTLKENVVEVIKALDERGVLQSISSKNDYTLAMDKLKEFNLDSYFLYPQINWNPKSNGIINIAQSINIGIDTLAFIDDQQFELDEVQFVNPDVRCINVENVDTILEMEEYKPDFITTDSKNRRLLYITDSKRKEVEDNFIGTKEEFLASLDMRFIISKVEKDDLKRAEELTVRTNQLNATGYTYSYEELDKLSKSEDYMVLISELKDKYGDYGKIGLTLVEKKKDIWTLKLLLMSCRVMSRGVGSVMLNYLIKKSKEENVTLQAEFIPTDRNRMMYITYKFAGFKEIEGNGEVVVFSGADIDKVEIPDYINLVENM
ncbi:TPA: HAD-IIIC family phosphatase [Bacillus thuringiensis]